MIYSFTHPHVIPSLWEKTTFWRMNFCSYNESQQGPVLFWTPLTFTCMNNERFGTALVWVNDDRIIFFEWSITLKWLRCVKMQTCCIYIICHSFRWILLFTLSIHTSNRYGTLFETAKNGVNPSRHLCTGPCDMVTIFFSPWEQYLR